MTNVATLAVAMVGSVITVRWLFSQLVRGVPEGYDSETEVRTPLVTLRRKVAAQRAVQPKCGCRPRDTRETKYHKCKEASGDTDRPGSTDN